MLSSSLNEAHPDMAEARGGAEIPRMTKEALLSEILRLPRDERIQLLGDAWDAIAAGPEDLPMPQWHLQEIERRLDDPEPQYVAWEEVRTRLKGST